MTADEQNLLNAANLQLHLAAIQYGAFFTDSKTHPSDLAAVEHRLNMAAKQFTRIVDQIDPKLWESTSTDDVGG